MIPLKLPPGVVRAGTVYDTRGRWYTARLIRWVEGVMQAWGGWTHLSNGLTDGPARGMLSWRANSAAPLLAVGTTEKLWLYQEGVLTDITPADFTVGAANAAYGGGAYGYGTYGSGDYGTGTGEVVLIEAQSWQLDAFGQDLVAVAYSDGRLLYRSTEDGGVAAPLANAPTDALGVVVTPERFVVALAANGDRRTVAWSDQEKPTVWAASPLNQAGDFTLTGEGNIMLGLRGRGETLIWTDTSLWRMAYIGGTLVYSFRELGSKCGPVSRRAVAMVDGRAIWMGKRSFFIYDGYVRPLPCDVADDVFNNLTVLQASKVAADIRADFGEVIWYYPSSASNECDSYVAYNYREDHWTLGVGTLERTAGADRGALALAVASDASGQLYQHETGTAMLDTDGTTTLVPSAESGPIEIGTGDQVMYPYRMRPDEKTLGDTELTLYAAMDPTSAETAYGPYTPAQPTDLRFCARQVRLKLEQVNAGWRFGTPRLDVRMGGER